MSVTPITTYEQYKELINSGRIIIIDFWAPWCGPCRAISPIFEKLSAENRVEFYKINIDDVPNVAEEVRIRVIPTFIAFHNGNKVNGMTGADASGLKAMVATSLLTT